MYKMWSFRLMFFLHWIICAPSSRVIWAYLWRHISVFSILFHCSVCGFIDQSLPCRCIVGQCWIEWFLLLYSCEKLSYTRCCVFSCKFWNILVYVYKNLAVILIRIALNWYIILERIDTFIGLVIHKQGMSPFI